MDWRSVRCKHWWIHHRWRTSRPWAIWPSALICLFAILIPILNAQGAESHGLSPLVVMTGLITVAVGMGWFRLTHLRPRDKRDAMTILNLLLSLLPDSSV